MILFECRYSVHVFKPKKPVKYSIKLLCIVGTRNSYSEFRAFILVKRMTEKLLQKKKKFCIWIFSKALNNADNVFKALNQCIKTSYRKNWNITCAITGFYWLKDWRKFDRVTEENKFNVEIGTMSKNKKEIPSIS